MLNEIFRLLKIKRLRITCDVYSFQASKHIKFWSKRILKTNDVKLANNCKLNF